MGVLKVTMRLALRNGPLLTFIAPGAAFVCTPKARLVNKIHTTRALSTRSVTPRGFGCEIELLVDNIARTKGAIEATGEPVILYNSVTRVTTTAWKLVPDLSLPTQSIEVVSPILRGKKGRQRLTKTFNAINAVGGVGVDKRTGYHVHIDLTDIDFPGLRRVCQNWVKYEDAIDLLLPPSRRKDANRFCRSVRTNSVLSAWARRTPINANSRVNERISRARSVQELMDIMNPGDKYYKLNLRTGTGRNTIEFRCHSGTRDPEKMNLWVNFLIAFVEASARNNAPDNFLDIRTPKYKFARLFEWVVRDTYLRNTYNNRRLQLE